MKSPRAHLEPRPGLFCVRVINLNVIYIVFGLGFLGKTWENHVILAKKRDFFTKKG